MPARGSGRSSDLPVCVGVRMLIDTGPGGGGGAGAPAARAAASTACLAARSAAALASFSTRAISASASSFARLARAACRASSSACSCRSARDPAVSSTLATKARAYVPSAPGMASRSLRLSPAFLGAERRKSESSPRGGAGAAGGGGAGEVEAPAPGRLPSSAAPAPASGTLGAASERSAANESRPSSSSAEAPSAPSGPGGSEGEGGASPPPSKRESCLRSRSVRLLSVSDFHWKKKRPATMTTPPTPSSTRVGTAGGSSYSTAGALFARLAAAADSETAARGAAKATCGPRSTAKEPHTLNSTRRQTRRKRKRWPRACAVTSGVGDSAGTGAASP
ncbi:hypothetical protein T492DRAFT_1044713 [Pavlovales sp. CCMP2436]|nr:hypothetical protein T492DRAFT_1044713 [Pavlovales sp. CCMP2436]|mmetsp:Transcript_34776/g.86779  ORF Transcript_34776/g.86779 Transcript_34776/m.86779 type:complete len:337 (-) Transcript_34776:197-1207(-)